MALKTIFLYGPPGSGKTTEGLRLARETGRPFVDLDAEIVRVAGRSIREIFATDGEGAFRALEKRVLKDVVAEHSGAVVALGGGALLDAESEALVRQAGEIRLLTASFDVLWSRVSRTFERPLVSDRENFRELLQRRAAHYGRF